MTSPPKFRVSPDESSNLAPRMKSRTPPAAMRLGPESPLATQPPMVDAAAKRGGSKASIWFCSARAFSRSLSSVPALTRSEEHTSELQSLMRSSYAVFCLKKKKYDHHKTYPTRLTVKHNVDQETINRSDKLT